MRLPFRAGPVEGMLRERDETFKELKNVFGIADDISVVGYDKDGTGYNTTL